MRVCLLRGRTYTGGRYNIARNAKHAATHPKLCPGVYRIKAWVKYTKDYDATIMVTHIRFYLTVSNLRTVWACALIYHPTAQSCPSAPFFFPR